MTRAAVSLAMFTPPANILHDSTWWHQPPLCQSRYRLRIAIVATATKRAVVSVVVPRLKIVAVDCGTKTGPLFLSDVREKGTRFRVWQNPW